MILISDSGSTKTDWVLLEGDEVVLRVKTLGLNPTQQKYEDIVDVLSKELMPLLDGKEPEKIFFYGAGCVPWEIKWIRFSPSERPERMITWGV